MKIHDHDPSGPKGNNEFEIFLIKTFSPKQKIKYFRLLKKKSNVFILHENRLWFL